MGGAAVAAGPHAAVLMARQAIEARGSNVFRFMGVHLGAGVGDCVALHGSRVGSRGRRQLATMNCQFCALTSNHHGAIEGHLFIGVLRYPNATCGGTPARGDYCSTSNGPGGCVDSFWFAATFAASAARIGGAAADTRCSR